MPAPIWTKGQESRVRHNLVEHRHYFEPADRRSARPRSLFQLSYARRPTHTHEIGAQADTQYLNSRPYSKNLG